MAALNLKVGVSVLQATRELRNLSRSVLDVGKAATATTVKTNALAGSTTKLGSVFKATTVSLNTLVGAFAAFGGGIAAKRALEFTANFETGLAEVQTLLGESDVPIERYKTQLLNLSTTSSKTLDDLTKGLYQTISAGIPAVEGSTGAFEILAASQKAAVAGLATTEEAVNAVTSVLNAYGRDSISATEVTDKLFNTVRKGRVLFPDLAAGIGRVAPIAAQAGVGLDEILTLLIQLTKAGISPRESITGIRNVLRSIIRPTTQTRKVLAALNEQLEKTGRGQIDLSAQALRRDGLIGTFTKLAEVTGGSGEALGELFPNIRALVPALVAVGDRSAETEKILKDLANSTGETARAFNIINDTAGEAFDRLISNLGRLAALSFEGILETLNVQIENLNQTLADTATQKSVKETIQFITEAVVVLTEAFFVLVKASAAFIALKVGTALGAAAAGFSALASAGAAFVGVAGTLATFRFGAFLLLAKGLGSLAVLLNPVGLALAGATYAFLEFRSMVESIEGPLTNAQGFFLSLGNAIYPLGALFGEALELIGLVEDFPLAPDLGSYGEELGKLRAETKKLNEETAKRNKQLEEEAKNLGFVDAKDRSRSITEVFEGTVTDVSFSNVEEEITPIIEAVDLFAQSIEDGPKKGVDRLAPAIEEFFKKFREGGKESLLTGTQLFERIRQEIQKTRAELSESEQEQLAASVSFTRLGARALAVREELLNVEGEISELRKNEILDSEDLVQSSSEGLSVDQEKLRERLNSLDIQKQELESTLKKLDVQLQELSAIDSANAKRREAIELDLETIRKAKERKKVFDALEKLERIREKNEKKIRDAKIESLKVDQTILENQKSLIELERSRLRLEDERIQDRFKLLSQTPVIPNEFGDLDIFEELKKQNDLRIKNIDEQEKKQKEAIETEQHLIESRQKLEEQLQKNLNEDKRAERDKDIRALRELQKVLSTGKVAQVQALVEAALKDIEKVNDKSLQATLESLNTTLSEQKQKIKEVESEAAKNRKAANDELVEKTFEGFQEQLKFSQELANITAKAYIDTIEDASKRGQLEVFLKSRADELNISVDEAASRFEQAVIRTAGRFKFELSRVSIAGSLETDLKQLEQDLRSAASRAGDGALESQSAIQSFQQTIARTIQNITDTASRSQNQTLKNVAKVASDIASSVKGADVSAGSFEEAARKIKELFSQTTIQANSVAVELERQRQQSSKDLEQAIRRFPKTVRDGLKLAADQFRSTLANLSLDFSSAFSTLFDTASTAAFDVADRFMDNFANQAEDLGNSLSNFLKDSGFAEGFSDFLGKGASVSSQAIVASFIEGAKLAAGIFGAVFGRFLSSIGGALTSPLQGLFGALDSALGVLTDSEAEQERARQEESLELQRLTLAQLQSSGASNEDIARQQARLADELAQSRSRDDTPEERLNKEIDRVVQLAINLAENLGPLVELFLTRLVEALPIIVPALVKAFVDVLDILVEQLPDIVEILLVALIEALPEILPKLLVLLTITLSETLIKATIQLVKRLPAIIGETIVNIFKEAGRAFVRLITGGAESLAEGVSDFGKDVVDGLTFGIADTAENRGGDVTGSEVAGGTLGGAGAGALIGTAIAPGIGTAIGAGVGAIIGGISSIFHSGGNVESSQRNPGLANMMREMGAQGFASGGMVQAINKGLKASLSDDVPALLQTGEAVLNRAAVTRLGGPQAVDMINNNGGGLQSPINLNVGISPNPNGMSQVVSALLPLLIGSVNVERSPSVQMKGFRSIKRGSY